MTGGRAEGIFRLPRGRSLGAAGMLALMLAGCAPPAPAPSQPPPDRRGAAGGPAGRCAALLALFDDLVLSRFDDRLLALERDELADARAERAQAGADCTAGRYGFGIPLIEGALGRIGVVPPPPGP